MVQVYDLSVEFLSNQLIGSRGSRFYDYQNVIYIRKTHLLLVRFWLILKNNCPQYCVKVYGPFFLFINAGSHKVLVSSLFIKLLNKYGWFLLFHSLLKVK